MSRQTTLPGLMTLEKGSEALAEGARTILRDVGYTDRPTDDAYGWFRDNDYLRYVDERDRSVDRWRVLKSALKFWYRQSPRELTAIARATCGRVTQTDPPETVSGMISVAIDPD